MIGLSKKCKDRGFNKKLPETNADSVPKSQAALTDAAKDSAKFLGSTRDAVPGRFCNDMLTYSVQDDYSFLSLVMESVLEGMPPMVVQDSKVSMYGINDSIAKVMMNEEDLPRDYVPGSLMGQNTKVGEMEVHIL